LRVIPRTTGQFLHTVREYDRLGLLAFKYYNDSTKWWQIADANPQRQFPADLLDQSPFVEELFVLSHAGFAKRLGELITDLGKLGIAASLGLNFFDEVRPRKPDFLESTVVVIYTPSPATHQHIVNMINSRFHFLRSFAWDDQGMTNEALTFDDPSARSGWAGLINRLGESAGVVEVQSLATEAILKVVYNGEDLARSTLLALIDSSGFGREPESATASRVGAQIVIPPNQTV
jgi:hypothetical protein